MTSDSAANYSAALAECRKEQMDVAAVLQRELLAIRRRKKK